MGTVPNLVQCWQH